jgi:hypothetical protein
VPRLLLVVLVVGAVATLGAQARAELTGSTYDLSLTYNDGAIATYNSTPLMIYDLADAGATAGYVDTPFTQVWSVMSTVTPAGDVDSLVIELNRAHNGALWADQAVAFELTGIRDGTTPLEVDDDSLAIEFTTLVPPSFSGSGVPVDVWTSAWTVADGLTVDISDIVPDGELDVGHEEVTGVRLSMDLRCVPEPVTFVMFAVGALGLGAVRRKR